MMYRRLVPQDRVGQRLDDHLRPDAGGVAHGDRDGGSVVHPSCHGRRTAVNICVDRTLLCLGLHLLLPFKPGNDRLGQNVGLEIERPADGPAAEAVRLTVVGIRATSNRCRRRARPSGSRRRGRPSPWGRRTSPARAAARSVEPPFASSSATCCDRAAAAPSTWPCTKWPSMRSPTRRRRSTCTSSPAWSRPRFVLRERLLDDVERELPGGQLGDGQAARR